MCANIKMAAAASVSWVFLVVVFGVVFCKDKEDDSCRTYAGGQVYPQEVKTGLDHALHWSKALSKFHPCFMLSSKLSSLLCKQ